MTDTYICAICEGEFKKGWSDEEAKAELADRFPNVDIADTVLICDDCNERFEKWRQKKAAPSGRP